MTAHILDYVHRPRDPDSRAEAFSLCGDIEECSGSGRHSMVNTYGASDCTDCRRQYVRREAFAKIEDVEF